MGKSSTLEPRKFFFRFKLPFKTINLILLTDEGLTLGTSALETLCGGKFFFFFFFFFFLIATRRTLLYKTRRTLLTIPPTRRYLFYLLYNTSLDCNSYPTFYSFFFFAYTPMYLLNYNSKWVSI